MKTHVFDTYYADDKKTNLINFPTPPSRSNNDHSWYEYAGVPPYYLGGCI